MRELKTLNPGSLPKGFDVGAHTEEPIVAVKESAGKIVIDYAFPGFYLIDDEHEVGEKKLRSRQPYIKSTGFLAESGKPLLPSFGRYVQIPHNCDYKISVRKGPQVQFEGIVVSPAQTRLSDNPNQKHVFEYNDEAYTRNALYPEDIVKVTGPFEIDGYCALLVHVAPLQYNPAKKELVGFGNVTVTIELTEKPSAVTTQGVPALDNEALGNLFLNPGQKIAEKVGFKLLPQIFKATGPELLIIYAKVFENAARRLLDWKNHRGLLTEAVCVDTIGNTVAQLKAYIRGRRGALFSRLRYVLLFGDSDAIVTQTDFNCIYGATFRSDMKSASDYYYSTSNDFDPVNPNSKLIYPWLSIGRIPVRPDVNGPPPSGDSQAQGVVDQIVAYEKNPPADPSFYRRMLFSAYFQGSAHKDTRGYLTTIEKLRSQMEVLGYTTERAYVSNDPNMQYYMDGTPIPAAVISAIVDAGTATKAITEATTEGQLFVAHRDHGGWNGWVCPSFSTSDLKNVTGDMPSVFYSINCETGGFDYPEPTECWAEANLRLRGTAPSLIAASRDSGTYPNNDLIQGIFDATFGGVITTFPGGNASYPVKHRRLGDILNYGKSYLPIVYPDVATVRDEFEIYHVIGDPTLELWTHLPRTIALEAQIANRVLDIHLSTCPRDAVLTIWDGARMLKRIECVSSHVVVPVTGLIPFPRPPFTLRPALTVCFWAPGYRFNSVRPAIR